MPKTVQPVERRFARFDSIAEARRHGDIQARVREIRSAEAAVLAQPINPGGHGDPGRVHMTSMILDQVAEKREALRAAEALDGDELVVSYCQDIIAQAEAPFSGEVLINGEPLARGAVASGIAPGMPR